MIPLTIKSGNILISQIKLSNACIKAEQQKMLYYCFMCPVIDYMELYLYAREVRN